MMNNRLSHAAAFGAGAAMSVVILALLVYALDLPQALNNLSYVLYIGLLVWGVKKWRDENNGGFLTFGKTYVYSLIHVVVFALVMGIWTLVFTQFIAPGVIEDQMLKQQVEMEEQGMSASQIKMAMDMAEMFTSPIALFLFATLGNIIFLGLINLVVSAIMKKDPPPFQTNIQ